MLAERVFEAVARFARRGLSKCQPRINQARNPGPNVGGGSKTYRFQQGAGKLLANYSRDLRDLLCRAETIEPQARLMSAALRKLTALISEARTCCIFTNQIREKIGVMFGNPETTPGGKALKFYASVRVDIRRIGAIKQTDGVVTGNRTRIKVVKNKMAPPFTEAEFDIMYNEGISSTGALLDLALEKQIIEKRGSWLNYRGTQLAQGRDAAKDALKRDRKLYDEIKTAR